MTNPPNLSYKPKNTILRFLGGVLQSLGLDLEFCLSNNTLVVFFFKNYLSHFPGVWDNEDLNICRKFLYILLALVRYICDFHKCAKSYTSFYGAAGLHYWNNYPIFFNIKYGYQKYLEILFSIICHKFSYWSRWCFIVLVS